VERTAQKWRKYIRKRLHTNDDDIIDLQLENRVRAHCTALRFASIPTLTPAGAQLTHPVRCLTSLGCWERAVFHRPGLPQAVYHCLHSGLVHRAGAPPYLCFTGDPP